MKSWFNNLLAPKIRLGPSEQIADLDAILTDSVSFTLHGKDHLINPLSLEEFIRFAEAQVQIANLRNRDGVTTKEVIDSQYALARSVCKSISRSDIEKMSMQQVAALYDLIMKTVSGEAFAEKKKKKTYQVAPKLP